MACSKLEARGHLLHKTGTPPKHFSRECMYIHFSLFTVVLILVGINAFLALFWAYVGQPDNHIGWATLMTSASIHSTLPKTNSWNFHEKILRISRVFESAIWFFIFFSKKNTWKILTVDVADFVCYWPTAAAVDLKGE